MNTQIQNVHSSTVVTHKTLSARNDIVYSQYLYSKYWITLIVIFLNLVVIQMNKHSEYKIIRKINQIKQKNNQLKPIQQLKNDDNTAFQNRIQSKHYLNGQHLLNFGFEKKAITELEKALKAEPDNRKVSNLLSKAKRKLKNKIKNFYNEGLKNVEHKNFKEAKIYFTKLMNLSENKNDQTYICAKKYIDALDLNEGE